MEKSPLKKPGDKLSPKPAGTEPQAGPQAETDPPSSDPVAEHLRSLGLPVTQENYLFALCWPDPVPDPVPEELLQQVPLLVQNPKQAD